MQTRLGLVHHSRQNGTIVKGINLAFMRRWEFTYRPPRPEQSLLKALEQKTAIPVLTIYLDEGASERFEGAEALHLRAILEGRPSNLERELFKTAYPPQVGQWEHLPQLPPPLIAIFVEGGVVQEVVTTVPIPFCYRIIDRDSYLAGESAAADEIVTVIEDIDEYTQAWQSNGETVP